MVFREQLLKKYSLQKIFKPLVNDLMKLEQGIEINVPITRTVKCGLLCYSSDNLEAHVVGGFTGSFSSRDVCRFCHCMYTDLEDRIHDLTEHGSHEYWTVDEYDRIIEDLALGNSSDEESVEYPLDNILVDIDSHNTSEEEDSDAEDNVDHEEGLEVNEELVEDAEGDIEGLETRGVRSECPFNRLLSFHCVYGFPPDVMHDLMEGVIPSDLLSINRILVYNGCFSITQYNEALESFEFFSYERNDKPYPLPTVNSVKKLRGKAVSNW